MRACRAHTCAVCVGAHSYVHACTTVVCVARASKHTLLHPDVYIGMYAWRERVRTHSHAHPCINMCDSVRVRVHLPIWAYHASIHPVCVSLAKTKFCSYENLKKRQKPRKYFYEVVQRYESPFCYRVSIPKLKSRNYDSAL